MTLKEQEEYNKAIKEFRGLRDKGFIAAVSKIPSEGESRIRLSIIGERYKELDEHKKKYPSIRFDEDSLQNNEYYFFGDLRPGAGVVRRHGGNPDGPGGTLTCLLESKDNSSIYAAAAGHILSNFWKSVHPGPDRGVDDPDGSIHINRKGFPGTNTRRSLGKLSWLYPAPPLLRGTGGSTEGVGSIVDVDMGIIELAGDFILKQRTTCYGNFGEWPSLPSESVVYAGQHVMKCGAEETHWTAAVVDEDENQEPIIYVYGPGRCIYRLRNQVILRSLSSEEEEKNRLPKNPPKTPFAVSGDSGTMVVDRDTLKPVGMLVAGSILDGKYVMTPIWALWNFWTDLGLVLRRA